MTAISHRLRKIPISTYILVALALLAAVLGAYRLAVGLEATTNLNDHYPWGIWIGLDFLLIPLAGAAFTVSLTSHFFSRTDYYKILRPALLVGLLGYMAVVAILILDLGRWHQFYNILVPPFMNLHSFLEEVALSVTLYVLVLLLEIGPVFMEKWGLDLPGRLLRTGLTIIAGIGILISLVHQSSLGSMYVILKHRLHPIWWTPMNPLFFLLQALFGGLSAAVVVVKLTQERLGMRVNRKLLRGMGRVIAILLAIFVVGRIIDWLVAGEVGLLFTSGTFSLLIWAELILGGFLPLAILLSPLGRKTAGVFWAAIWAILGMLIFRFAVGWIALESPQWATYVPHWMEVMTSVGILAGVVLAFNVIADAFDLFPEHVDGH